MINTPPSVLKPRKMKGLTIIKRNGKVDLFLKNGIYNLTATVTIENGIKYIDDGIWTLLKVKKKKWYQFWK